MVDNSLALYTGVDIPLPELQLIMHNPSIKEISMIGEREYLSGAQCLTIDKNKIIKQGNSALSNTSNFQLFMSIMRDKETKEAKANVTGVLSLLFPNSKINFTPRAFMISSNSNNVVIDESNFEYFQQSIKPVFCIKEKKEEDELRPADAKAQDIANKIKRARAKVSHIKGEDVGSPLAKYASVITVALQLSPREVCSLTLYQLYDILERYNLYTKWDLDIRSRLAGADSKDKPEDWTRNIHLED